MSKTKIKYEGEIGYIEGYLPGNGLKAYAIVVISKKIQLVDIRLLEILENE